MNMQNFNWNMQSIKSRSVSSYLAKQSELRISYKLIQLKYAEFILHEVQTCIYRAKRYNSYLTTNPQSLDSRSVNLDIRVQRRNRLVKRFLLSLLIIISLMSISSSNLLAYDFLGGGFGSGSAIGGEISIPKAGMFDPLIQIYNKLIALVKKAVESNMKQVVRSANILLSAMATAYIVVMGARSFLTGSQFLSAFMEKMFGFLCLLALLQFDYYDKYILSNLESLFNGLPTLFGSGGGDIITNIISQTSFLASEVWKAIGNIGWGLKVISMIAGAFAVGALTSLTLVVLVNVLILTVEFYFVLSISSILILLFFFKFTRSISMGAVQIVFGAILKVTLLSLFLSMFGGIIKEALVFDGEAEFFSACMGVILISVVGIVLIKVVNDIANRITGGVGQMAGANIPNLMNTAKGLMGR